MSWTSSHFWLIKSHSKPVPLACIWPGERAKCQSNWGFNARCTCTRLSTWECKGVRAWGNIVFITAIYTLIRGGLLSQQDAWHSFTFAIEECPQSGAHQKNHLHKFHTRDTNYEVEDYHMGLASEYHPSTQSRDSGVLTLGTIIIHNITITAN